MDEKKFADMSRKDAGLLKYLSSCETPEKIAEFLSSNGIKLTKSESEKIFCVVKYFEPEEPKTLNSNEEDPS
jgi:hypothetical protein